MRTSRDYKRDPLWVARARGADVPAEDIVLGKFYVTFFVGEDTQIEAELLDQLDLGVDVESVFLVTTSRLVLLHLYMAMSWELSDVEGAVDVRSRSTSLRFGANRVGVRAESRSELNDLCQLINDLRILQPVVATGAGVNRLHYETPA